jgi:DNA-binding protein HU-beta
VTKAEFLDVLARDSRIGNKKEAGQAVDAVLDAISDVLRGGGEVNFTGFGKFAVAERGPLLGRVRPEEDGQGRRGRLPRRRVIRRLTG